MKNVERYLRIATFIFVECARHSESGNWVVDFEEIEEFFGFKFTEEIFNKVVAKLYYGFPNAILSIESKYQDKCFDITIGTDYTINNNETNEDYNEPFDNNEEFEF